MYMMSEDDKRMMEEAKRSEAVLKDAEKGLGFAEYVSTTTRSRRRRGPIRTSMPQGCRVRTRGTTTLRTTQPITSRRSSRTSRRKKGQQGQVGCGTPRENAEGGG
jgi:hypothetical protein